MANQLLTLTQIQDAIWTATVAGSGLDPQYVRHAYPTDGQPGWLTSQNVIIINITPYDDPINKQRDISYPNFDENNANETVSYIDVFQTQWTFYGPQGYDLADQLRSSILLEEIRDTLSLSNLYPVPSIAAPTRLPYNFAGQWWEQADLKALFNTGIIRQNTVPYLLSVPIQVNSSGGPSKTILVEAPPFVPSLRFNDRRNSQYAPFVTKYRVLNSNNHLNFTNSEDSQYVALLAFFGAIAPLPTPRLNFTSQANSQYVAILASI